MVSAPCRQTLRVTWVIISVWPGVANSLSWQAIPSFARRHPLAFGVGVTTCKTAAADFFTQRVALQRRLDEIDRHRISQFAAFGALYLGAFQHVLWCDFYPRLLPKAAMFAVSPLETKLRDTPGFRSVIMQVALDQGLHWPLCALPTYYIFKGLVGGELKSAVAALRRNWKADVLQCWKIWVPAELIMFGALPLHWQVPFAAVVSFVYMALLSLVRGEL